MDLQSLDTKTRAEEGEWMTLVHPGTRHEIVDENGETVQIKLLGRDSETYRAEIHKANREATKNSKQPYNDDLVVELLVKCTVDWEGVVYKGDHLECTHENAKWLYHQFPWIREQADTFQYNRANYLGN